MEILQYNHLKHNLNGKILVTIENSGLINSNIPIKDVLKQTKFNEVIYQSFLESSGSLEKGNPIIFFSRYLGDINGFILGFYPVDGITPYIPDISYDGFYIASLFVLNSFQNKGLGSQLINLIINHCKSQDYKNIYLTVNKQNTRAILFYKKKKFELVKSLEKMFVMKLSL